MLGFGELIAHETAWRLGWGGTKVSLFHTIGICKEENEEMLAMSGDEVAGGFY